MGSIFTGARPRIVGATVYALNRTHGLTPPRAQGAPEVVSEVIDAYHGVIKTTIGHTYANGDFGILRFAEAVA